MYYLFLNIYLLFIFKTYYILGTVLSDIYEFLILTTVFQDRAYR